MTIMHTCSSTPSSTAQTLVSPLYTEAEYGSRNKKITAAEKSFMGRLRQNAGQKMRHGLDFQPPGDLRVRLASTSQARREPNTALPKPGSTAHNPVFPSRGPGISDEHHGGKYAVP